MIREQDLEKIQGLTVKFIHVDEYEVLLVTECGREFKFYHDQDCCESVSVYDTKGELVKLEGKKLVSVEYTDMAGIDPDDVVIDCHDDSFTWSSVYFKTSEDTVCVRWLGESNGYYGEDISLREIQAKV